ncbi:MAG TPA: hypothetical protein VLH10_20680 [Yinghuangia sp.]|uniref:hypothetical protein n=1 Tax=Yinghuangia sp. YIM S10712 TaxID=3436930 RepID=UPI002CFE7C51|nr:hypothetical protein [Yinghuangia sp.]
MRPTRLTVIAAIAAPILLVGCGSQQDEPETTSAQTSPSQVVSFQPPTDEQKKAVLTALAAIDPALTKAPDTALFHAMSTCDDIRIVKDQATVVSYTADRYRAAGAEVDIAKAGRIVEAIKSAYCTS